MPKNKLYQSEAWLKRQVYHNKKKPEQIAEECGAALMTIYRYFDKFGIKR